MSAVIRMIRCEDDAEGKHPFDRGAGAFVWIGYKCFVVFPSNTRPARRTYCYVGVKGKAEGGNHPWNGDRDRPTFRGSVDAHGHWHGWIIDGLMSSDLKALKAAAAPAAVQWFEGATNSDGALV